MYICTYIKHLKVSTVNIFNPLPFHISRVQSHFSFISFFHIFFHYSLLYFSDFYQLRVFFFYSRTQTLFCSRLELPASKNKENVFKFSKRLSCGLIVTNHFLFSKYYFISQIHEAKVFGRPRYRYSCVKETLFKIQNFNTPHNSLFSIKPKSKTGKLVIRLESP
jgi:hypothetical protein